MENTVAPISASTAAWYPLQDPLARQGVQRLTLVGHGERLGDGLLHPDGQRLIEVGARKQGLIHELVALYGSDGPKDTLVGNALFPQLFDKACPPTLEFPVFPHGAGAGSASGSKLGARASTM